MKIKNIYAVYFSPTGNTKKIACFMAEKMAEQLNCPHKEISFTLPEERNQTYTFGPDDLSEIPFKSVFVFFVRKHTFI